MSMRISIILGVLLLSPPIHADELKAKSSPRLRFKNGPVCMCSQGLTEKDIQDAMQARSSDSLLRSGKQKQQNETSQSRHEEEK